MARLDRRPTRLCLSPEQLQGLIEFFKSQDDVLALYLYGSYGTEYQTDLSDIDLAVLPMPGVRWDYAREARLQTEVIDLGRSEDISLVNLRRVPVTLQINVLETGRLLYVRDRAMLADFVESVILRYCDFLPDLENLYRDFDIGIKEEFCDR